MPLFVNIGYWGILIYALLVAVGGLLGYLKARSKPSLVSGLSSGLLLLLAWLVGFQNVAWALAIATFLALALLVVFILRYRRTRRFMPAGLLAILSFLASGLFGAAWLLTRA